MTGPAASRSFDRAAAPTPHGRPAAIRAGRQPHRARMCHRARSWASPSAKGQGELAPPCPTSPNALRAYFPAARSSAARSCSLHPALACKHRLAHSNASSALTSSTVPASSRRPSLVVNHEGSDAGNPIRLCREIIHAAEHEERLGALRPPPLAGQRRQASDGGVGPDRGRGEGSLRGPGQPADHRQDHRPPARWFRPRPADLGNPHTDGPSRLGPVREGEARR